MEGKEGTEGDLWKDVEGIGSIGSNFWGGGSGMAFVGVIKAETYLNSSFAVSVCLFKVCVPW